VIHHRKAAVTGIPASIFSWWLNWIPTLLNRYQ
jgi:hypothetical protein